MGQLNISFDRTINGMRYIIKEYSKGVMEQCSKIESSIPNDTPMVYSIEYSEETGTFQMTDYIEVRERRIKVMFNLDLNLNIVGFIYNDLDGSYDMINPIEYFREDNNLDTETVYLEYIKRLIERLSEELEKRENNYNENNMKMLGLHTIKID